jgi:hypothetical protein
MNARVISLGLLPIFSLTPGLRPTLFYCAVLSRDRQEFAAQNTGSPRGQTKDSLTRNTRRRNAEAAEFQSCFRRLRFSANSAVKSARIRQRIKGRAMHKALRLMDLWRARQPIWRS